MSRVVVMPQPAHTVVIYTLVTDNYCSVKKGTVFKGKTPHWSHYGSLEADCRVGAYYLYQKMQLSAWFLSWAFPYLSLKVGAGLHHLWPIKVECSSTSVNNDLPQGMLSIFLLQADWDGRNRGASSMWVSNTWLMECIQLCDSQGVQAWERPTGALSRGCLKVFSWVWCWLSKGGSWIQSPAHQAHGSEYHHLPPFLSPLHSWCTTINGLTSFSIALPFP